MLRICGKFNINADVVRGDKSLCHRALIFASIANGKSVVRNLSLSEDVLATADCLRALGAKIEINGNCAAVTPVSDVKDGAVLNCKNSGTTARLLAGLVAGLGVKAKFIGDSSLSKRPMDRVIKPLTELGASFQKNDGVLFQSLGGKLKGKRLFAEVNSAQVKSAVLIAGLFAEGQTSYVENIPTRNHTETMLGCLGADVLVDGKEITVTKSKLKNFDVTLPKDVSSAAYLIAAALLAHKRLTVRNVLLNERRIGFMRVLQKSGANIRYSNVRDCFGEKIGDITVEKSDLSPLYADLSDVCDSIDEIPLLSAISLTIKGRHVFNGVNELKFKESDRVNAVMDTARKCGQQAFFDGENLTVISDGNLKNNPRFKSFGDHRIAMCQAVLCLFCGGGSIDEVPFEVSFPEFYQALGLDVLKLGLVGTNVAGSMSPFLMEYLASNTDVCCSYGLINLPADVTDCKLLQTVNEYSGLNVTMPFKQRMAKLLNADCASVNTVGKGLKPQSTDGYGIIKSLEYSAADFKNKPLRIVGAGGAAVCCIETLLKYGCKIQIINRTQSRAEELTKKYRLCADISSPYGVLSFVPECEFEQSLVLPDGCKFVFVADYKGKSGLKKQALQRGITVVDGLQMLYYQGAKSFSLWTDTPLQDDYAGFEKFLKEEGLL